MGSGSLTTIVQYVVPALLGLVGGVVGSLVAPWVQWAIEQRRSRMNNRRELIKTWREDVERFTWDQGDFRLTATYSKIKPHLGDEVGRSLQTGEPLSTEDGREVWHKEMLLDEAARIEKEWGLI
jgi:hypothetical protein